MHQLIVAVYLLTSALDYLVVIFRVENWLAVLGAGSSPTSREVNTRNGGHFAHDTVDVGGELEPTNEVGVGLVFRRGCG